MVLIGLTSSIQSFAVTNSDYLEGWETIGGLEYSFWNPTYGHNVTPNSTQIVPKIEPYTTGYLSDHSTYYFAFTVPYGSGHAVRVKICRNNSEFVAGHHDYWKSMENCFIVTRLTNDWPVPNQRKALVSFETVLANTGRNDFGDNVSASSFMLGKMNCTLFITANVNMTTNLWANDNYTVRIGTEFGTALGRASMWTVLGQLLTMRLPDCHWAVSMILAIPLWAGIGFMAVTIISRFIPFIGGG